jgi:hemerythrin
LLDGKGIKMATMQRTFSWTERYSVNIAVLDRQHQALFDTINELQDALTSGHGSRAVDEVLKKLAGYALNHFSAEESLMTEHAFPGLETYRTEHKRFARNLEKFLEDYKGGQDGSSRRAHTLSAILVTRAPSQDGQGLQRISDCAGSALTRAAGERQHGVGLFPARDGAAGVNCP